MQTLYRINTIAGFKPWRSGGPFYLEDASLFDIVKGCEYDGTDWYRIPAPGAVLDEDSEDYDEDNTLSEWLYQYSVEAKMPYILADEVTFYTE